MSHSRLVLLGILGLTLFVNPPAFAQKKVAPIVPAEKLAEGWDEIDQRLVFLMVRLANTETSLESVEKAIGANTRKKTVKAGDAKRADLKNEEMDRRGGGPMRRADFYGTTAEKFFYHPTDRNTTYHTTTVLSQQGPRADNKVGGGVPAGQGLPVHQRPPQFDYIYRANEKAKERADEEAAEFKGKIEELIERRQRLEAEQAGLWVEIAFRAIAHYDLDKKPLYRFEPLVVADGTSKINAQSMKAASSFMALALSIIIEAEKDQATTFSKIKPAISQARQNLNDTWLKLAVDVTDRKSSEGRFASLAKRLEDVASNLSDSYVVAIEGDQAKDQQRKDTFRGTLQESLVSYAQIILALDEMSVIMKDEWKIKPDADRPIQFVSLENVTKVEEETAAKDKVPTKEKDADKKGIVRPPKIDVKLLKKKFAGKVTANPKTGELVFTYDFKKPEQLNDFELNDTKPTVKAGTLIVGPGDFISHIVNFKTATVSGIVSISNVEDIHRDLVSTTGSTTTFAYHRANGGNSSEIVLKSNRNEITTITDFPRPVRTAPFSFGINGNKVTATFFNKNFGGEIEASNFGSLKMHGGSGGIAVSPLVITGVPDEEWLNEFLSK
jgi:hypothetical protein